VAEAGEPSVAASTEGLPAEAPPSVETDVEAKAGPVVEAKEGESSEAPPSEGAPSEAPAETSDAGTKEGTDVDAKAGLPTKE
jgi:hypothetical protein